MCFALGLIFAFSASVVLVTAAASGSVSRFVKRGTVVDGMSDQPFSTSVEARRNRRHASWMLSLLLVPDGSSSSSSSSATGGAVAAVGGCQDAANLAGKNLSIHVFCVCRVSVVFHDWFVFLGGCSCLVCIVNVCPHLERGGSFYHSPWWRPWRQRVASRTLSTLQAIAPCRVLGLFSLAGVCWVGVGVSRGWLPMISVSCAWLCIVCAFSSSSSSTARAVATETEGGSEGAAGLADEIR